MAKRKLSPWIDGKVPPVRKGFYQAQDAHMNCSCCHCEVHWDGEDWHAWSDLTRSWRKLVFRTTVKRWRGLAQKATA